MKISPLIILALTVGSSLPLIAQPKVDPKTIINDSNGFLKEREPEITAEENALYEKIVPMLATQPALALKLLEGMVNEKEQPSPAFACILGNAYYSAGEKDKAEASYRSAVKRFPTFLRAWGNLGVFYYSQEKFSEAVPCFTKAIALGDREPTTFGLLGYSLEKTENIVSAEMSYMQALAGDPGNTDWKEGLLRIYMQAKQYPRAEMLVRNLIKDQPRQVRYWLTYANVLMATNRKLEAIALLEQTVALGFADQDELGVLADLYAGEKMIPEAVATYQKIRVSIPSLGEQKLLQLAQILIADSKWQQAQDVLATLEPQLSSNGKIAYMETKADLLAAQKKWPEARTELEALLQLAPLDGNALVGLGRAYAAQDDIPHATLVFETACQVPESTYRACIELANIEIKNRHFDKSVAYLEKALGIEKSQALEDYLTQIRTLVPKEKQPTS
jgi:tetratricopeptide (TPR) repeat protein